jgi:hypothetical protein
LWRFAAAAGCWCWSSSFSVLVVSAVSRQIPAKCERGCMSRGECRCRVPIEELAGGRMSSDEAAAFGLVHGLQVELDYLDRPSVSVEQAFKYAERRREAQAEAEAQLQAEYQLRSRVAAAEQRREEIRDDAVSRSMGRQRRQAGAQPSIVEANAAALLDVADYERSLPAEVRERLAPLGYALGWASD